MSKKARNVVYVLNDEVPTDEAKDPIQERLDDVMRRKEVPNARQSTLLLIPKLYHKKFRTFLLVKFLNAKALV